jgi:hypothetical protein
MQLKLRHNICSNKITGIDVVKTERDARIHDRNMKGDVQPITQIIYDIKGVLVEGQVKHVAKDEC